MYLGSAGRFHEETHPELSHLSKYQLQWPFPWLRNPGFVENFGFVPAVLPRTPLCLVLADFGGTPGWQLPGPSHLGQAVLPPLLLCLPRGMVIAAGS